ncbi:unnamed protein product, partial [Coregonus sp. 'balchen']
MEMIIFYFHNPYDRAVCYSWDKMEGGRGGIEEIGEEDVFYSILECSSLVEEQTKSNLKVTSPEDSEQLSSRQGPPNGTPTRAQDPKGNGSRTVPRRHTLGGARSSQEILAMQPSDMDKKREAFLEHLKQKYPHHASAIMGHQERLREQVSDEQ